VNYWFQHHVTRSTTLGRDALLQRVGWACEHLDAFDRLGGDRDGFRALELGSGWYPIVPLCFFLAGADEVRMVDLEDLGRDELAVQAVRGLLDAHAAGDLASIGPVPADRLERLAAVAERIPRDGHVAALASVGVLTTPGDARTLEVPAAPDLISSNTVFEHIAPDVLEAILVRFARIARPGTVMSHLVDHGDHYAYVDESVGIHHFLRYGDRAWRWIDNGVQPMNRLRASEYEALYARAGVPLTEVDHRGCDPLALVGVPLAPRFREMDPADVACTSSLLLTRFG
jgi:hypothetical protein